MTDTALADRESMILSCVVESYVKTAVPVGSRNLAKAFGLGISPATIRNVMNDLEELGYLCQPHVSAGRIPTDKGYRFFVDSLMSLQMPRKRDRDKILENLDEKFSEINEILGAASRVLGKISSQLGVVLEPRFNQGVFQKMELVSVSGSRVLAVISIQSGLVRTITMEIASDVSDEQLSDASRLINERLCGLSLREVKEQIDSRLADVTVESNSLIRLVLESSEKLFNFDCAESVYLGGASNFVSKPEFSAPADVARMLDLLDSRESFVHQFDRELPAEVSVSIGQENAESVFRGCSVVTSPYRVGNVTGMLGVVGPTRMQYGRIIPLVGFMGDALTRRIGFIWS